MCQEKLYCIFPPLSWVKYQQVSQVSCAAGISVIVAVYQLDSEECKTEKANQTKHFCHLYH